MTVVSVRVNVQTLLCRQHGGEFHRAYLFITASPSRGIIRVRLGRFLFLDGTDTLLATFFHLATPLVGPIFVDLARGQEESVFRIRGEVIPTYMCERVRIYGCR
jgi:hypothetical protein